MEHTVMTPPDSPLRPNNDNINRTFTIVHNDVRSVDCYAKMDGRGGYIMYQTDTNEIIGVIKENEALGAHTTEPMIICDRMVNKIESGATGEIFLKTDIVSANGIDECINSVMEEYDTISIENREIIKDTQYAVETMEKMLKENKKLETKLRDAEAMRQKELKLTGFLYTQRMKKYNEALEEKVNAKDARIRELEAQLELTKQCSNKWYYEYNRVSYINNMLDSLTTALTEENRKLCMGKVGNPMKCTPELTRKQFCHA